MICQLCLSKPATTHLTERSPAGKFAEAHYCAECYEAKYLKPSPGPASFPRPRFTLKRIMILVAGWAVPNAITAWIMRSGFIIGTPQQLREWNIAAFLAVNLMIAFFVVWAGLMAWLQKVTWYNQTGGVLPMPVQKRLPLKQQFKAYLVLIPLIAWIVAAIAIGHWLTPKIWPGRRENIALAFGLMFAPFLPFVVLALYRGGWKNPARYEHIRLRWSLMSPIERVLRVMGLIWTLGFVLLMIVSGPSLIRWGGLNPWFPIPAALLILVAGQVVLMAGIAFSARRR